MRRGVQLAVTMALLMALVAGVAYAADIQCDGTGDLDPRRNFCEGTPDSDTITGNSYSDHIIGRAGNDTIFGLEDTDDLLGQKGDDTMYGGQGHDILRGRDGNDHLFGGDENQSDETKGPRLTDEYFCGDGIDTVHVEKSESAPHNFAPNCEIIVHNN
jgi:Ca2+-binding RTX toxin-like protein